MRRSTLLCAWSVMVVGAAGCGDTPEALDAYLFGPTGMAALVAEEAEVIEQFNRGINTDLESPDRAESVRKLLREDVLPRYRGVADRMRRISVENTRVAALHGEMLAISGEQQAVLEDLAELVENGDFEAVSGINERLGSLGRRRAVWEVQVEALCRKYEITQPGK